MLASKFQSTSKLFSMFVFCSLLCSTGLFSDWSQWCGWVIHHYDNWLWIILIGSLHCHDYCTKYIHKTNSMSRICLQRAPLSSLNCFACSLTEQFRKWGQFVKAVFLSKVFMHFNLVQTHFMNSQISFPHRPYIVLMSPHKKQVRADVHKCSAHPHRNTTIAVKPQCAFLNQNRHIWKRQDEMYEA